LNSPIPRQQGLAPFSHRVIGAQTEVKASIGDIEVYLDNELAPGGFAWLAPTSGESALAGLVTRPNAIRHLRTFLERLQRDGRIASISSVGQKAIPVGMRRRTVNGRFAIVGEAAGQTKATTFGGIYTGLLCADLLVDTILAASAGNSPPEPVLKTYDRTWRQKIGGELARGYRLRRFYDSLDNRSIDRIFKIVESNGLIQRVLKRSDYSFDWHSGLLTRVLSNPGQVPSLLFHGPVWSPRMLWEFARMVLGR
jgi:flavin-dependent dehydrogenase